MDIYRSDRLKITCNANKNVCVFTSEPHEQKLRKISVKKHELGSRINSLKPIWKSKEYQTILLTMDRLHKELDNFLNYCHQQMTPELADQFTDTVKNTQKSLSNMRNQMSGVTRKPKNAVLPTLKYENIAKVEKHMFDKYNFKTIYHPGNMERVYNDSRFWTIEMITKSGCPYSIKAFQVVEELMKTKPIFLVRYEYTGSNLIRVMSQNRYQTFPQIWINNVYIKGGYTGFVQYLKKIDILN